MKKIVFSLAILTALASCQSAPEGNTANVSDKKEVAASNEGQVYTIDNTTSTLTFVGTKPVGTHTGEMKLASGSITVNNGNISSGNLVIDMTKIESKDKDTNYSFKLIGHLMSPDFFDVAKYPTSKFEITSCSPLSNDSSGNTHTISGNLTLKDSTKNISFPAKISIAENNLTANADFIIDRTQWGLYYGNDKSLKDKFIYPEVKIMLNVKAKM